MCQLEEQTGTKAASFVFIWSPLKFAVFWDGSTEEDFEDTEKHDYIIYRNLSFCGIFMFLAPPFIFYAILNTFM